jgi:hypothetical protein
VNAIIVRQTRARCNSVIHDSKSGYIPTRHVNVPLMTETEICLGTCVEMYWDRLLCTNCDPTCLASTNMYSAKRYLN